MPQLKNKFLRKTGWLIYGICGLFWPFLIRYIFLEDYCTTTSFELFIWGGSFLFLHWLALKLSQNIGLRDKKINFLRDPALYWMMALYVISSIAALPTDKCMNIQNSRSGTAANSIVFIVRECDNKKATGELNPTFTIPKKYISSRITEGYFPYTFLPKNRLCNGDENNLIKAESENTEKYPTFSYNVETGKKICSHNGPNEELHGCSARRNGEW